MRRLVLLIVELSIYLMAGTACLASILPASAPVTPVVGSGSTSTSSTVSETLCVEGWTQDGTWWACP